MNLLIRTHSSGQVNFGGGNSHLWQEGDGQELSLAEESK